MKYIPFLGIFSIWRLMKEGKFPIIPKNILAVDIQFFSIGFLVMSLVYKLFIA